MLFKANSEYFDFCELQCEMPWRGQPIEGKEIDKIVTFGN